MLDPKKLKPGSLPASLASTFPSKVTAIISPLSSSVANLPVLTE